MSFPILSGDDNHREPGDPAQQSDERFLFYPAGLLTAVLLPPTWQRKTRMLSVLMLFAAMNTGIEYCQYRLSRGYLQTDDVIHNTLGALLGVFPSMINLEKLRNHLRV